MTKFRRTDLSAYFLLDEFRVGEKFYDVVINIGDRSFPCHRIVLASSMAYFRNLFYDDYVAAERKEIELELTTNADDFEHVLRYVYGTSISVSKENVLGLLEISHHLLGPQCLRESCVKYAAENHKSFALDSVLNVFAFASETANAALVEALTEWMAENFAWMSKREKFSLVCVEDLLKVLTHPNLITNLMAQLDFLLNWFKLNYENESESLTILLNAMIGF